jgi:hypothetical protein
MVKTQNRVKRAARRTMVDLRRHADNTPSALLAPQQLTELIDTLADT